MAGMIVSLLVSAFIGLFTGCTAGQSAIMMDKEAGTAKEAANKQIAFEKADPEKLDKDIYRENDFLKYISGYNYWKTPEGYIFIISGGPAGTPGHEMSIRSVEEDKEGRTVITVEQSGPPAGQIQEQVVTFPRAVYKVHAENENFVVKTEDGTVFSRYPKNEFSITGTVTDIISIEDFLYPPHYIRVIPDADDNRMNGSYFVDFVQFNISNGASKQAKELHKGDKVSIVYDIGGMDSYNVKSITRID